MFEELFRCGVISSTCGQNDKVPSTVFHDHFLLFLLLLKIKKCFLRNERRQRRWHRNFFFGGTSKKCFTVSGFLGLGLFCCAFFLLCSHSLSLSLSLSLSHSSKTHTRSHTHTKHRFVCEELVLGGGGSVFVRKKNRQSPTLPHATRHPPLPLPLLLSLSLPFLSRYLPGSVGALHSCNRSLSGTISIVAGGTDQIKQSETKIEYLSSGASFFYFCLFSDRHGLISARDFCCSPSPPTLLLFVAFASLGDVPGVDDDDDDDGDGSDLADALPETRASSGQGINECKNKDVEPPKVGCERNTVFFRK